MINNIITVNEIVKIKCILGRPLIAFMETKASWETMVFAFLRINKQHNKNCEFDFITCNKNFASSLSTLHYSYWGNWRFVILLHFYGCSLFEMVLL